MVSIVPIPTDSYSLGFIGAGKMAESIARGVVKSGILPASRIQTAHTGKARRGAFESFGVKVFDENRQVLLDHLCVFLVFFIYSYPFPIPASFSKLFYVYLISWMHCFRL